jgi:hypothetical protein
MKIGGILYAEKAEAGKAVIEACKAMISPDPVPLGEYRGFSMILSFDSYSKEYRVTLSGALSHTVKLGTDIHGRAANRPQGRTDTAGYFFILCPKAFALSSAEYKGRGKIIGGQNRDCRTFY